MNKDIKPINDYLFISIEEKKEDKEGIILSDISRERQPIGRVEAVGPEVKIIKAGDQIIFNVFVMKEIALGGEKLYLLKEKDIYGYAR